MNFQDLLLNAIRHKLKSNPSINEAVAIPLNISYDAAHRRVSGKSKFSVEESFALAHYYSISLDSLFKAEQKVIVEKTTEIESLKDMLDYFRDSANRISELTKKTDSVLYYSAKDIPLFYFMDGTILSKFKAYVWLSFLQKEQQKRSFEDFVIDESFLEHILKLKNIYNNVYVKEIWNDTTINSSLQQIVYFYESGLLSFKNAAALFKDLKRILKQVKEKSYASNPKYQIYYNEIILLNNNMLIESNQKLTMFIPYTLLGYFITDNKESCLSVKLFFDQQINNSKLLNQSGLKDQNQFFDKAFRKIDYYSDRLNNQVNLEF